MIHGKESFNKILKKIKFFNIRWMNIIYVTFTIASILFFVEKLIQERMNDNYEHASQAIQITGTYQQYDGDEAIPFQQYSELKTKGWKQLILKGHVACNIDEGENIMLYLDRVYTTIYLNNEKVYQDDGKTETRWDSFITKQVTTQDLITVDIRLWEAEPYDGAFQELLANFYVGRGMDLYYQEMESHSLRIHASIVIFLVGLLLLSFSLLTSFFDIQERKNTIFSGMLLIFGGITTFINFKYVTLLFEHYKSINFLKYMSFAFISFFLMLYLKTSLRTKKYIAFINKMIVLWMLLVMVYYIVQMIGDMYQQSAMMFFVPILLVFLIIEFAFLILDYIHYNEKITKLVLFSGALLAAFTLVELVHYFMEHHFFLWLFQIGLFIFAGLQMYLFTKCTRERVLRAEHTKQLEIEVAQSRIAVTLSQIQPHFLYNALATIRSLCNCNPEIASTAIDYFTTYLRSNMEFLNSSECIPFQKELTHVKSYLYIEQLRFVDRLDVEYEIGVSDFRCPPLVLQTIVENAIKHGICNKLEGGKLVIATYETHTSNVIVVKDDGIGFNPKEMIEDGRLHVGIENSISRLRDMCNGDLIIDSKLNQGTNVTIIIPKDET